MREYAFILVLHDKIVYVSFLFYTVFATSHSIFCHLQLFDRLKLMKR